MNLKNLVLVVTVSLLATAVHAVKVEPLDNLALSSSARKQKTSFVLSEPGLDLAKQDKISVSIDNPNIKVRPKKIAFKTLKKGSLKSSNAIFFVKKSFVNNLEEDVTATVTFTPSAGAQSAGIETSTATITIAAGDTVDFPIELNFGGQLVLPQSSETSSRLKARTLFNIAAGEPTQFKIPANAGSCALGIGSSPLSTSVGPGDGSSNRLGSGSAGDPLYLIFNNPDNGGVNEDFDLNSIPASLADTELTGFSQYYEGRFATGQVLATVTGTLVLDSEDERFDLTTDDGVVVSYFKDGSKQITEPEDLSSLAGDAGLDVSTGQAFLSGESLPIAIPEAEMEGDIISGIEQSGNVVSNVSVDLTGDMTGTLTLSVNKLNGEFTGTGTISFDAGGTTISLSGSNNLNMTISADNPATVAGSTLQNATGTLVMSGGTGAVQSITADFILNNADVSIDSGITGTDVTITNIITVEDPNFDDGQEEQQQEEQEAEEALRQCLDQCAEQGGDSAFCSETCANQ